MLTLLKFLSDLLRPEKSGSSPDVPASDAGSTSTLSPTYTLVKVERMTLTTDGVFGRIWLNGEYVCESVENLGEEIPEGLYDAIIDVSPRLGYACPHIRVPMRDQAAGGDAGIRIHKANEPCQLEGCIAPGLEKDGDAEDNSKEAFDKLMAKLPPSFKVLVYSVH